MSQASIDTLPASTIAALVTLRWGDPVQTVRYTTWTSDLVLGADTFLSEPLMEVVLPEKTAASGDRTGKIAIPAERSPFNRLVTGYKHARVSIVIEQVDPLVTIVRKHLFSGWLGKTTKNPSGRRGLAESEIKGIKSRIAEVRLSLAMTTTCQVPFGGRHCQVDASSWTQEGTVLSVGSPNPTTITLDLPSVSSPGIELINSRFAGGIIDIGGLRLRIKGSKGDKSFELHCNAAPFWVGQAVKVYAGCDKKHATCKGVWLAEDRFMGLGIKIPPRNPIFEAN